MDTFKPTRGVTKPSTALPTVMPSQNPTATMPLAKSAPWRTLRINVTIHPPSATSAPM